MRRGRPRRVRAVLGWIAATLLAVANSLAANSSEVVPATPIAAGAPEWRELAAAFARQPDTLAMFEERPDQAIVALVADMSQQPFGVIGEFVRISHEGYPQLSLFAGVNRRAVHLSP